MVIGVAFVAGVFYSVGLLLPTPIQLCRKNKKKKKKRRKKGLISRSALWGCLLRKCEGDGIGWQYAVWHHEGN